MHRWLPALFLAAALSGAALAQVNLGERADSKLPIEITADNLEVQQDKQVAIFTGNVDAKQGDMRLKADTLKVFYRQDDKQQTQTARPKQDGAEADATGAISKIEAIGNVFVSSPEETAQGERGIYDVIQRVITLEGKVVLTQGQNVLRGQRATMNLATGRSVMETTPGGRVRGLFVPNQNAPSQ